MGRRGSTGLEKVHIVTIRKPDKPIRHYIYAWRGGPCVRKVEGGPKPKLNDKDLQLIAKAYDGERVDLAGTIAGLIKDYEKSPEWEALADGTKKTWGNALLKIDDRWGKIPLTVFSDARMRPKLVKWRDSMADTPRAADIRIYVLSRLLKWAMLHGKVAINAASDIPHLYKDGSRPEIIWTADDIQAFYAAATLDNDWAVVDALDLASVTGLRRADLIGVKWTEIGETAIIRTAAKKSGGRRKRTVMPRIPDLDAVLERLQTRPRQEGVKNVLVTAAGLPWEGDALTAHFKRIRKRANDGTGIWHKAEFDDEEDRAKHLHDVRGTFATKLMTLVEPKLTDKEIGNIMGWDEQTVSRIRKSYVDETSIVIAIGERIQRGLAQNS